ncbi:hypothetical protein MKY96_09025 [Paenibacillus sp. FSL R7-0302]|uniref:hypothetical protein n=1 Tax=Paenibacillus sp. FSL R7-0302 TaxID=2921681 RepID=UPI0030F7907C
MEKRIVFKGKRPAELPATISVVALMVFWICYFLRFDRTTPLEYFWVYLVVGIATAVAGIMIYRLLTFSRVFNIGIRPEVMQIKNVEIEASAIKQIFIKGHLMPVIAVKPKAHLLVPYKYCFRFPEQEDQGIKALKEWADRHQIEVVHKKFVRWL